MRGSSRVGVALLAALAFSLAATGGCGGAEEGAPDAATPRDAGRTPRDAWTPEPDDASEAADAAEGTDAETAADAAELPDASEPDAAGEPDAGELPDAGDLQDAGAADVGGEPDAYVPPPVDAGASEPDAGQPGCGDGACSATEDCGGCPADCGACPPMLSFNADWTETLSGPIVAGRKLRALYALERLPQCRSTHNGYPGWSITLYYSFDLGQPAHEAVATRTNSQTNTVVPAEVLIDVPAGATDVWLWAKNTDVSNCIAWDSNFGANYRLPVFSAAKLAEPLGWVGNFDFAYVTDGGGAVSKGDRDPAYYFATMSGQELSTEVRVEVYLAGVTDRAYQDDAVTAQVAKTAVRAVAMTDAREGGAPGGTLEAAATEYLGKAGNNFRYRWFPGPLTWKPGWLDGAYRYRLELSAAESVSVTSIGKPGANSQPRTYVLSKTTRCDLFASNPPADFCP